MGPRPGLTDISLFQSQCCDWTSLLVLITVKMHLSNNHQGTLKRVYYSQVLEGTQHVWGYSMKSWLESERVHGPGVQFLLGSRVGCLGFPTFTSFVNLKHKSGIKVWEGKSKLSIKLSVYIQPKLSKEGELHGWGSLAFYLIM